MLKYTVRRFFEMLLTIFVIATATFFLLAAVPGDPLADRADRLPEAVRDNLYHKYGLDKPVLERYVITMKGMLHGDFGESVRMPGYDIQKLLQETLAGLPDRLFLGADDLRAHADLRPAAAKVCGR